MMFVFGGADALKPVFSLNTKEKNYRLHSISETG